MKIIIILLFFLIGNIITVHSRKSALVSGGLLHPPTRFEHSDFLFDFLVYMNIPFVTRGTILVLYDQIYKINDCIQTLHIGWHNIYKFHKTLPSSSYLPLLVYNILVSLWFRYCMYHHQTQKDAIRYYKSTHGKWSWGRM